MKTKQLYRNVGLGVSSLMVMLAPAMTFAATTTQSVNDKTNTLKLSPLRSDLTLTAGTSGKVTTFLTNLTGSPISVNPIENDFIAGDEKGTPSLILDENSYAPTHSLKRFMVPLADVTIPAHASKEIDVTITVPKSAQAGGYYGAIRFAPAAGDSGKSVNLSASVASLILLTVPGNLVDNLKLTNFDIQQNGGTASNFRTPTDLALLLRFQNSGNVQESPYGAIYVQKGNKTVYSYNFNNATPRDVILPDSARRWLVPLKNLGKFGKYKITGTFGYGSKGQNIQISKTIWIIPTTYIVGGIVAVLGLAALILAIWILLRSYKRRILRSSRRRY